MKVIIIADSDPRKKVIGGIGIYAYNLVSYLDKRGDKVIFIGKAQEGDIINKFNSLEFIAATKRPGSSNYSFLMGLYKVARKLKLDKEDIIHAQRADWILPFRKFENKKIITLHGSHSKNVFLKKGFFIGKIYSLLEKKGLKAADSIISVSEENAEYYRKRYSLEKKIVVIPVGIDLSRFKGIDKAKSRKKYGLNDSDKVVIYVGRFEKEKNLEMLIKGCKDANVKLILVGSGREEAYLKQFSKEREADVLFMGAVENDRIPEILSCADVFGITSLYEGLPTVVIEAMAAGLPVVATEVGDMRKLVVDGETGYIVDERNVGERIEYLMNSSKKFKDECLKKAEGYAMDSIISRILMVYTQ